MPGLAELALAGAPIAGGALLGVAAGNLHAPDVRNKITADLKLLKELPPEDTKRRAELQRVIDSSIDDLIAGADRGREIRKLASSYEGNWRDIVVFVCALIFTFVWWNVSHSRENWLLTFIVLIALTVVVAIYAGRGIFRGIATYVHGRDSAK